MNTVVIVTGGFDPIHSGHIAYFKAAKTLGDYLVVGINSDKWLTQKKGMPFMSWKERAAIVGNLSMVDEVIAFDDSDGTATQAIEQVLRDRDYDPDLRVIFANGGDRKQGNVPEEHQYYDEGQVSFVYGVGGEDKQNSSSWILDGWRTPKTIRPWGWYRVLDNQVGYKVKELVIEPGKSLSDQRHFKRAEHWYVLKGVVTIALDNGEIQNGVRIESHSNGLVIGKGTWHRAFNDTDQPVHILEVQYGEQCIEEDIERRA